jgi:hypothetical protein
VGFYGGINYGFGYGGVGFFGGEWRGGAFAYNTAVMNVNTSVVRNVYVNRTVIDNNTVVNRASFNGEGGVAAQPRPEEQAAMREQHFQPTSNQVSHEQAMSQDRNQLASFNHGTPGTAAMDSVNGRRFNQQGRIAQGISSGQLTPGETKNLENREARLNGEIHNDRAANGGTLTPQERQQVNGQQNNLSRSIYNDKHNAATEHYGNNEVGARRDLQQQRIANGVASGQLSPSETARAENHEQNINRHIAADRAANGGKLTPQEKKNINQRQNNASRQIYNEKHNGNTVKPNEVDDREANQQQRTAEGLRSGQMTSGEAARTNQNQAKVAQQVHNERTANGGALTKQQKQQVNREQNKNSKQIYNEKHNNKTSKPAKERDR